MEFKSAASWPVVAALITWNAGFAIAQDSGPPLDLLEMSLEDLLKVRIDTVYGSSKYQQKVTEAPAAITIITADEIRRYGYRTLADVLRHVPGFYLTYDRNYSYLGVRGLSRRGDYNSRVLLLLDGHQTNDNIFDEALLGTEFPLDLDLIDRVEVIRGPNSSLYVASAFLGVINVITKPAPARTDVTASAELGSYGTYRSRLTYGQRLQNGLGIQLSGSYYNSAGQDRLYFREFDTAATNHGVAENADGDESRQLFGTIAYGDLRFQGLYGSREKHIPTASFGTVFNDPRTRTIDARAFLDVAYDRKFGSDWGIAGRIYYDRGHYDGLYVDPPDSDSILPVLNRDVADGQWWGAEFAVSKKLFEKHTLILGSEYRDNFQQDQSNYNEQPYFSFFDSRLSSQRGAVYVQDEIHLFRQLTLNVGFRHDRYSTFGGTTNPRAALIYQPFKKTTVKLLYGQSFRGPNAYELYYAGEGQEGNPSLRPETGKTSELVLEQYFRGDTRLLLSGYYYPIRNLISQQTNSVTGNIIYRNNAQIDMRGVEISLRKRTKAGLEAAGSVSFQRAGKPGQTSILRNSPRILGQGNLSIPLFRRKLYASAAAVYVSKRRTAAGDDAGAYVRPDLTLFSQAFRHWDLSASLYNALGQKYGDPGSIGVSEDIIYQDGRNFRLKLSYHF